MLRTSIPVSVWEQEEDEVINTAFRLLSATAGDEEKLDPNDPESWQP
jgi:hypothetical protein